MKRFTKLEKLPSRVREKLGFYGSLLVHFLLFICLAFSGVMNAAHTRADQEVVYFDVGGGGGGGGGGSSEESTTAEEALAEDSSVSENGTAEADIREQEQELTTNKKKAGTKVPRQATKRDHGSGTGSGGGHGSGVGTGTGSGTGPGSGSGSGGGHGSGHGTGTGSGMGPGNGIASQPKVPPRVISTASAYYPQELKQAGVDGRVVLRLVIGTNGAVESAEVVRSSGNTTLDANALSAIKKWRFTPAKNNLGQKVRCYFIQAYTFKITYE